MNSTSTSVILSSASQYKKENNNETSGTIKILLSSVILSFASIWFKTYNTKKGIIIQNFPCSSTF